MAFTCNSCGLAFPDAANQREHMKSDWHRYNLKRRVAQLPPIDEDSFVNKVASLKIEDDEKISKKDEKRRQKEAILEQKRKILETARKAMQQRKDEEIMKGKLDETIDSGDLEFQKEVEKAQQAEQANEPPQLTPEQQQELLIQEKLKNKVDLPETTCLFCSHKEKADFESVDANILHMFSKHGLYVPEPKYLVNKTGLIKYLGEKIGFGNVCLCCNYQGKNLEAVREHMKIKRHMRIPYESEDEKLEISEFYDFTTSYDVNDDEDDDGEWEDIEGEDDEDDDDIPSDGAIIQNGHELILPSGRVLGHRSLQRYYRQNLPPERELTEAQGTVIAAENRNLLQVRDKKAHEQQKRDWKSEIRRAKYYDKKFSKNMNNQEHYRDQLLQ